MAVIPAIMAVAAVASAAASIKSGSDANIAAKSQAEATRAQAEMQGKEVARQSVLAAEQERKQSEDVQRRQKLAYLASGVTLEGSPLLMMEETRQKGLSNIDEILNSGAASISAGETEGRIKSAALQAAGRQALNQGIGSAVSTIGSYAASRIGPTTSGTK